MGLSNAERQQRWRDRRKAAGLGPPPWKQAPAGERHPGPGDLQAALVALYTADPDGWGWGDEGETPEDLAARTIRELVEVLYKFAHSNGLSLDWPDENPAAEAARLRVMALLSAIMPIPTREERDRREKAEREAKVAKKRAEDAVRRKEKRAKQREASVTP